MAALLQSAALAGALALVSELSGAPAVFAQGTIDDETAQRIVAVSEAFLDQIVKEDFAAERKFLSPRLAETVSGAEWRRFRLQTIERAGQTRRYTVHGVTYYDEGGLMAAVDFSGPTNRADIVICGFLLWDAGGPETTGLLRFEQNIVPLDVFRKMPVAEAAQMLVTWRCPAELIESSLGIRLR